MPRQDGRIEQGQSLKSAISARAWNRAQDAADIVLGQRYGFAAGPITTSQLPSVRARLADKGWYGQVRTFSLSGFPSVPPADVPFDGDTISDFSDAEKNLLNWSLVYSQPTLGNQQSMPYDRIAVCVSNNDNEYAISGFAFARVRVIDINHKFARLPVLIPGQSTEETNKTAGCLDSAHWGVARVVAYVSTGGGGSVPPGSSMPFAVVYRWALIHF